MHLHFFKAFALLVVLFTASATAQCTCQGPNTFCNLASECCSNQCVNRGTPGFNMGKKVITFGGKKMSGKYKHTVRTLDNTSNGVGRESIVKRCSHISPDAARMCREVGMTGGVVGERRCKRGGCAYYWGCVHRSSEDSGFGTRAGPRAAGSAHAEGSADDAEVDGVRRTDGATARTLEYAGAEEHCARDPIPTSRKRADLGKCSLVDAVGGRKVIGRDEEGTRG
ncbi:hypothetical protein DFH08DRAFT_1008467 [Mycena albidolilacea]|uniref:Uncharacterized protein n=1 Tax=Mycena albidolilacea TaxID=1033008 RepID=A0AAD6ZZ13_9AGAR|nr:hypothetical protein DFH08DRAFT_1008467 [Mycena albidolilacea]